MQSCYKRNNDQIRLMALATFYVGGSLNGIDILKIHEISRTTDITQVPQSPDYVKGLLNLRGQIITIIDLSKKLGLSEISPSEHSRNFIVDVHEERIGLLVDKMCTILLAGMDHIEPPPAYLGGVKGKFFNGMFKTGKNIIGVLNVEEVLKVDL